MNRLIFFFVVLMIYPIGAQAQDKSAILDGYMNDYQYQKALFYIQTQDETKEILFKKALCYRGLDNNAEAAKILLNLSQTYKDDIKIMRELANCYKAQANWNEALKCYDALINIDKDNAYYLIQRADMQFQSEDYKGALSSYKILVDEHDFQNMIKRKGLCYEKLNRLDSAIVYYAQAWARDSTDTFSAISLVNANLKIQKPENVSDARVFSEIYQKRDSTNKQMNLLNALAYYASDVPFYDEAIARFEKCYAAGDSSLVLIRSMGMACYALDYNSKAKPFLVKAHQLDSVNSNVLFCLARASNSLKDYDDATEYFNKLLDRVIPPPAVLYFYNKGLAEAYQGNEKYDQAVVTYKKVLEYANPDQQMHLYYSIGTMYDYDLLQPTEALKYYLLYKQSLVAFLESVKKNGEVSKGEIKELEYKIKFLQDRIDRLQAPKPVPKTAKSSVTPITGLF